MRKEPIMTTRNARTARAKPTISMDQPPEAGLPSVARATGLTRQLLQNGGALTPEEQSISRQTRTQIAEQVAIAVKVSHGQYLAHTLMQNTERRYAQFLAGQRALLDQDRDPQDQANLERFCALLEKDYGDAQRAFVYGAVDAIAERGLAAVTPPAGVGDEEVIIEVQPGLLGKVLGGTTVTRRVKK
jgi:hypothetical protein